jgi:diguanylate cyclase (GGDEF)-like protein
LAVLALYGGLAPSQAPLRSLAAVEALDNRTAAASLPVNLEATVTYFRPYEQTMFVEDGGVAGFVLATTDATVRPGDRIRIRGTTHSGLRPYVVSSDIALVGHDRLPQPRAASFSELISAADDCMRVVVQGHVRSAVEEVISDVRGSDRPHQTALRMLVSIDGGEILVRVDDSPSGNVDRLLDAEVELTGIAGGLFDGKLEQTGVLIHVASLADVKVLALAKVDPWSLPAIPFEKVMSTYQVRDLTARERVHGTLTFYQPGSAAVLQEGSKSLWISTVTQAKLEIGEVVDAIGYPDTRTGFLTLNDSLIRELNHRAPVTPQPATWDDLAFSRKVFDLVAIEGRVVTENRETGQDEYVVSTGGHLFTAILRHAVFYRYSDEPMPPPKWVAPGSKVRITGVCIPEDSNPFVGQVPFSILLRSFDDVALLAPPSPLSVKNLLIALGIMLLAVIGLSLRAWLVERRSRRQTASTAYIEKRRGRILEDINKGRPLAEIVGQITELVSARLQGAPCWCQIVDGARLGNRPAQLPSSSLRIVEVPIPSRSGATLGTIDAAFDARTKPRPVETETLDMAAALAALAIETSRLYSDLVHRSEFDLLTDAHNRFSLDRQLEEMIARAREHAGNFGLIYVDLDEFKQVNDIYGHHIGDLYLQDAAARMKRQMRAGDVFARLGGDEFAALIPGARNRSGVDEIAQRLERCFAEPFELDGHVIRGTASVGVAMYPEDGATKDSLLMAADAAMYVSKHMRREE